MKRGNLPPGYDAILFSSRARHLLYALSPRHSWTYKGLWLPSHGPPGESQSTVVGFSGARKPPVNQFLPIYYTNIGWRQVHYTVYGTKKSDNGRGEAESIIAFLRPVNCRVEELPSNNCYIIHIGKILTMLYVKKIQEEHLRPLWLSISSGSCMGVGLHKTVLLNSPFLYEETFKYPYRWLVCSFGFFCYRPRLTAVAPLYRSETLDCAILPQLDLTLPLLGQRQSEPSNIVFLGWSRGTNGPIRLLSCAKCIIYINSGRGTFGTFPAYLQL